MPIYEYECNHCSFRFERKRKFSENTPVSCPQCGNNTQRIFSPVPIIFKGSGFYSTDSRQNYSSPAHKGDTDKTVTGNMESKRDTDDHGNKSDE